MWKLWKSKTEGFPFYSSSFQFYLEISRKSTCTSSYQEKTIKYKSSKCNNKQGHKITFRIIIKFFNIVITIAFRLNIVTKSKVPRNPLSRGLHKIIFHTTVWRNWCCGMKILLGKVISRKSSGRRVDLSFYAILLQKYVCWGREKMSLQVFPLHTKICFKPRKVPNWFFYDQVI